MKRFISIFVILVGVSMTVLAHHSGAPYDNEKQIEITGAVGEWKWQNPHAWLRLIVKGEKGNDEDWSIEATSPNILLRQGWRRSTLKEGDMVTVLIHPLRDGNPGGSLLGARLADGTELGAPPGSGGSGSLLNVGE